MVDYSKVVRVFMVTEYIRAQSYQRVQVDFAVRFPDRDAPPKWVIHYNYNKYQESGTFLNRNKSNSGRRLTLRTQQTIAAAGDMLQNNPRYISCRRNGFGISVSSFHFIVKKDLRWNSYRLSRPK